MANYDFRSDLVLGNNGEDDVIKDLNSIGARLILKNNDNRFDFIMEVNNHKIKYEVKTDVYCTPIRDTGNMFVEFECRNKPSGIMVTEAKWFVTFYRYLNEIWYIETEKLKTIFDNHDIIKTNDSGDLGSNTRGWLLPRNKFKKEFIVRKI